MKTKAKLTLAISVMTAAVLAAGVTSTFAWFTTKSTATLSTGTMTVSTVSSITVNVTKLAYDTATTPAAGAWNTATDNVEDKNVALGPVSSVDGLKFYAPKALNNGSVAYGAGDMGEVTDKTTWLADENVTNQYVGYVKYGIRVQAGQDSGTARTLKYTITSSVTDEELQNCYRVAFYDATYSSGYVAGDKIGIFANATANNNTGWKYASSTYQTGTYATAAISGATGTLTEANPEHAQDPTKPETRDITTARTIDHYYIFSVWVEGAHEDATNAKISAATLSAAIEFSLV